MRVFLAERRGSKPQPRVNVPGDGPSVRLSSSRHRWGFLLLWLTGRVRSEPAQPFSVTSWRRDVVLLRVRHPSHARRDRDAVASAQIHARHRMAVRLPKPGISPRITHAEALADRAAPRRRRDCTVLPHRHLVASQCHTTVRQHHHLRARRAIPEHLPRPSARIAGRVSRSNGQLLLGGRSPRGRGPREPRPHHLRASRPQPPDGNSSAAGRARASPLNTPFGNCTRYASNSAAFVLFMIDCQNNPSSSAEAGGDATPAGNACGRAAVATVGPGLPIRSTTAPDASAVRRASAAAPSRYPVARDPRDLCQLRIAARVRGPNNPSAPPGSNPLSRSPRLDRSPRARSSPRPSSTRRAPRIPIRRIRPATVERQNHRTPVPALPPPPAPPPRSRSPPPSPTGRPAARRWPAPLRATARQPATRRPARR